MSIPLPFLTLALLQSAGSEPLLGEVHRALPLHPGRSVTLQVADFDGDGALDVLSGAQRLRLARSIGGAVFEDASDGLPLRTASLQELAAGDVDGDGDVDVVLALYRALALWRNDGAGAFADATGNLPPVAVDPDGVLLFDADGDGDLDLFLTVDLPVSGFPVESRLYLNDGTGAFADASANLPVVLRRSLAAAAGDVDGDGDLDLVIGNRSADELYLNDGSGVFTDASAQLPGSVYPTVAVLLGDLDGDLDLDLVLVQGNGLWDELVLLNDGAGSFAQAGVVPDGTSTDRGATLLDAEGDGDLDLYVAAAAGCTGGSSCNTNADRLYLNDGAAGFTRSPLWTPPELYTWAAAAEDLDGDGDLDLLVAGEEEDLFLNDGQGVFLRASVFPGLPDTGTPGFIGISDFDRDGNPDAFLTSIEGGATLLLGRTGLGFDEAGPGHLPPGLDTGIGGDVGDIDGDGDDDVFLGTDLARNRILLNDGAAFFTEAQGALPHFESVSRSVVLGDVDGDGDLDAVVGNQLESDRLFLNQWPGFVLGAPLPEGFDASVALASGDFDLDGDLDFVGSAVIDSLMLNEGDGVFTGATANLPGSGRAFRLGVGDVDADGDPDILEASDFPPTRLLLNDGLAVFTDASATNLPALSRAFFATALLDVDGDGDLDALMGRIGYTDELLLNDGAGVFASHPELLAPNDDDTRFFATGDLDEDGDVDVLVGNYQDRERLWLNLTRQVARRNVAGIGKDVVVDLHGPAGGFAILGLSDGVVRIPLSLGVLRLDPRTLLRSGAIPLGARGHAALPLAVPLEPSFLGRTFWMQALLGPPYRLSNLDEIPITAF